MGGSSSSRSRCSSCNDDGEVNFEDFQILRAIGKGSFGKVCIVQKKDDRSMYAMKYMSKGQCIQKDAIKNVMREIEILTSLEHPFLVNLWFSFQDDEDMFMVVDLLLGGDLRYHIQQGCRFNEDTVALYIAEIALALDYLRSRYIIHRDIKPDNILLDEAGHVHITDFNIATFLEDGQLATSMSGTKPYMAPEIFDCALNKVRGYNFSVDWWSLGVTTYEILKGKRPYDIHSNTPLADVRDLFDQTRPLFTVHQHDGIKDLLSKLLCVDVKLRVTTTEQLKLHPCMKHLDMDDVYHKNITPGFIPSKDQLNCDPTFELEEMIIEAHPLHKKKKRLSKQNSRKDQSSLSGDENDPIQTCLDNIHDEFLIYNRLKELKKKEKVSCEPNEDCAKHEVASSNEKTHLCPDNLPTCDRTCHSDQTDEPLNTDCQSPSDHLVQNKQKFKVSFKSSPFKSLKSKCVQSGSDVPSSNEVFDG